MEILLLLIITVAGLVILGLLAVTFGCDSREPMPDDWKR